MPKVYYYYSGFLDIFQAFYKKKFGFSKNVFFLSAS